MRKKFDKAPPCDQLGPGDGVDPRLEARQRKPVINRKALQLCAQVRDALNLALAGCADDALRDALVDAVLPAPDSAHLLVHIVAADRAATQASLQRAADMLRSEVATAINRRKAPELRFEVLSRSG